MYWRPSVPGTYAKNARDMKKCFVMTFAPVARGQMMPWRLVEPANLAICMASSNVWELRNDTGLWVVYVHHVGRTILAQIMDARVYAVLTNLFLHKPSSVPTVLKSICVENAQNYLLRWNGVRYVATA